MSEDLKKFYIENITSELKILQFTKDKIIYLVDIKTQYKQLSIDDKLHLGGGFLLGHLEKWCNIEIQKLKELEQLEQEFNNTSKLDHQVGEVELENLSQQIVMFHELGIFQHLRDRYKIHEDDNTTLAKLFSHLTMNHENLNTKVASIKNLKKAPDKIISKRATTKINTILFELNLSQSK